LLRERENEFQETKIKSQLAVDLQNAVKETLQVKPKKAVLGKHPIQLLETHKKNLETLLIQQSINENKGPSIEEDINGSPNSNDNKRL
jgi:hypothetical protein